MYTIGRDELLPAQAGVKQTGVVRSEAASPEGMSRRLAGGHLGLHFLVGT